MLGSRSQSKGNHIWTVEAKKIPDRKWVFREFVRCIKGSAPSVAFAGLPWTWAPRVWDPQRSSDTIDASFMSPTLPDWLSWENNVLSGVVPASALRETFEIEAVATFQMGDQVQQLKATTRFFVASPDETEDPAAFASMSTDAHADPGDVSRGDESRPSASTEGSSPPSPNAPKPDLYRSPSTGAASAFDSGSQSRQGQLLPAFGSAEGSYPESALGTPGSAFEASFSSHVDPRQLQDTGQHQQSQQHQYAEPLSQAGDAAIETVGTGGQGGEIQMDDAQSMPAGQAALHAHYSTTQMAPTVSYQGLSSGSLSYAPPPELVQDALQHAIPVDSSCAYLPSRRGDS